MHEPLTLLISSATARAEKHVSEEQLKSFLIGRGPDAQLFLNDPGISRHHCRFYRQDQKLWIADLGSQSGTWLNGERLAGPSVVCDGDELQLGSVSLEIRFTAERAAAAAEATVAPAPRRRSQRPPRNPDQTMIAPPVDFSEGLMLTAQPSAGPPVDIAVHLGPKPIAIGRDASSDVMLDSLMVSRHHAQVRPSADGFTVHDLGSTNGTYVNGQRLTVPRPLKVGDILSIGAWQLTFDGAQLVSDPIKQGAEIAVLRCSHEVIDRETGRPKRLLEDISLTVKPGEFVGLLGTSGAGKSTFMGAVSGRRPSSHGSVLFNGEDLYRCFDSFKNGIGFVPQEVIFHDALPLIEALRYISQLRLSKDVSPAETEANIERVLKTVGLGENRSTIIRNLSGGQKKRVSIAMELLSQPRILFLDEVTSGLDPRTEKQMMKLFRELADSGITVVCITHYANSVEICDQIAYLNKGWLIFYGPPGRFKEYFQVEQIEQAYDKEDQKSPVQWHAAFRNSDVHAEFVSSREASGLKGISKGLHAEDLKIDWKQTRRQLGTLTRRYVRVLAIDRRNLLLLLLLPPLTAVLLCILASSMELPPAVFDKGSYTAWMHKQKILCFGPIIIIFLLSMFGSIREIVKELAIYHHERFVNLQLVPYLLSKIGPLACIGAIQTLSVVLLINGFADTHAGGIPAQFLVLFLVNLTGMLLGLAISAMVKSSDWAIMLMIGVVVPQLLFAGALVPVRGASAVIAKGFISSYWGLEGLKHMVEDYYIANHVGVYELPERSQTLGCVVAILLFHLLLTSVALWLLMLKKDGPRLLLRAWTGVKTVCSSFSSKSSSP